jgi:membrane protease subunit HflK
MHRAYHPAPPAAPRRRVPWLKLFPWLALVYLATGFYTVQTNEQAVVRRCGKFLPQIQTSGLHFGLPYGIDRVDRLKMFEQKRVAVGMSLSDRVLGRQSLPQQSECLTGDRNLILVSAVIQYHIEDPKAYLLKVKNVDAAVANTAAASLASVISGMNVDDVLTVERLAIQGRVLKTTQESMDRYGAGVKLDAVSLEGVAPPQEVAEAFRDVTAAREDKQRAINEAEGYRNRLIPQARGEAQRIQLEAEGYADETVTKAQGDASRFSQMAAQLAASGNRALTFKRLVLETMEQIFPRLNKVIVDEDSSNPVDLGLIETK